MASDSVDLDANQREAIAGAQGWVDDSAAALRAKLAESGLDIQPLAYSVLMRLSGADKRLQPGLYKLTGALTQYELVQVFERGEVELSRVTIPEGLPYWEVVPILAKNIPADSGRLYDLITDADFASKLGVEAPNLEGYLLPETYTLFAEQAPEEVLTLLVRSGLELLDSHSERLLELSLSKHELLTLASLIEAEATAGDERVVISAVFHNRLREGWKLQCDPTVIYALGGLDRPLYRKDLDFESSYNTYLNYGLPPGPICSAGRASIEAALYPAESNYFYFVADGRGRHIFSRTLNEHNRACRLVKQGLSAEDPGY